MKRVPLAVLLALTAFAFARADDGAYKNLVGMARAASTDRGPDPGDVLARTGTDALKDALADVPSPRAAAARPAPPAGPASPAAPGTAPAAAAPRPDAVSVPAARPPRLWTLLYSRLLPARRPSPAPANEFEAPVSTAAVRTPAAPLPALMPPPDSEAVEAGERRGMAELMSVASPTGPR